MSEVLPPAAAAESERAVAEAVQALEAKDLPRAIEVANAAIARGLKAPILFNLASHRFELEHRWSEAAAVLERGLEAFPNDLELLTTLGFCLSRTGYARRAVAAFDTVLQAIPDFAPAHYGKGAALERLTDPEGAERHYRAASDLMPDYADPVAALSALLARQARTEEAAGLAEQALAADPSRAEARVALAYCRLAEGRADEAQATIRPVIDAADADPETRAAATAVLGDVFDSHGRFEDAFSAYHAANVQLSGLRSDARPRRGETFVELAERLTAWFAAAKPGGWRPERGTTAVPAAGHAFIVNNAARVGLDLLERTLGAHPRIARVASGEAMELAERTFLLDPEGIDRLATLDAAEGDRLRAAYWARAIEIVGDPTGTVIVDRARSGASDLCLIAALFPEAKVILALRDPRDAVLTAFRRPFAVNPDLAEFMTLEGAARLYDLGMRLLDACGEKLPLEIAEVRLEDLAADPKAETASLAAFLGLDADPAMIEAASSDRRGNVLRRRNASSFWRDYAVQLEPVMPVLKPWIERFGYPEA